MNGYYYGLSSVLQGYSEYSYSWHCGIYPTMEDLVNERQKFFGVQPELIFNLPENIKENLEMYLKSSEYLNSDYVKNRFPFPPK